MRSGATRPGMAAASWAVALRHGNRPCDGYGLTRAEEEELRALAAKSSSRR